MKTILLVALPRLVSLPVQQSTPSGNGHKAKGPRSLYVWLEQVLIANLSASTLAFNMVLAHPRLKLVYISEFSDDAAEDHPGPLPPDAAVLQKPFPLDALLVKIRSVLDNKSSAR